jgi:hypothetical protein
MYKILLEEFLHKRIDEITLNAAVTKGWINPEEKEMIILLAKAGVKDGV